MVEPCKPPINFYQLLSSHGGNVARVRWAKGNREKKAARIRRECAPAGGHRFKVVRVRRTSLRKAQFKIETRELEMCSIQPLHAQGQPNPPSSRSKGSRHSWSIHRPIWDHQKCWRHRTLESHPWMSNPLRHFRPSNVWMLCHYR